MSGEKKRLEQFLLQSRASNIVREPTLSQLTRFQPEKIDTIRLRAAQKEAGKLPVSEKLVKQQQKKKRKAKRGKQLRGEVGRSIREQRRFERGERRDRPEDEPRVVGEPRNTGLSYDPDIERRRLDIQQQQLADANLRALGDRRAAAVAQERELGVRRGELAAGRAERRLERERLAAAAAAAPAPVVIPPAAAPNIRVEAPRIEGPLVEGPLVAGPLLADPIPEIQRLGAQIRADVDAFGVEQRDRNRDILEEVRRQSQRQGELEARQGVIDEQQRQRLLAQDASLEELQARLGMNQVEMGRARDVVIQEIRDAEGRLRQATGELNRPEGYDDVFLRAVDESVRQGLEEGTPEILRRRVPIEEVESPTPLSEPEGIEGVIRGGGELNLPNVVIQRPGAIGAAPDESLRLSPQESGDRPGAVVERINPETGRPFIIERLPGTAGPSGKRAGGGGPLRGIEPEPEGSPSTQSSGSSLQGSSLEIPTERLRRGGGSGGQQFSGSESQGSSLQGSSSEESLQLDPVDPVNVADALRLSRLAIDEAEPVLQLEEADQEQQDRLRLVDSQDFLAGFEAPSSPSVARPSTPVTPALTTSSAAEPATPEEEAVLEEFRGVVDEPLRPVSEGIAQFGGGASTRPVPSRVIEDAGIVAQPARELRPLDPDVLFEPIEEAEQVGQVVDNRPQIVRDSNTLYGDSLPDLTTNVRAGRRALGERGGVGYRLRNNTDRTLKKVQPGDVVNITGVEAGVMGEGRFRLDTQTQTGTRVSSDQLQPLIDDGSFLFERGHRHELGGHFDEEPYGPPAAPQEADSEGGQGEPGLLQQGAEAVAGVAGAGARLAGGVAQGVGEGLYEQLPAAGDVGAAIGRGAVAGVAGAGRLAAGAAGAVGEAVFGQGEVEPEP